MSLRLKIWLVLGAVMTGLMAVMAWFDHREVAAQARQQMLLQARDLRATLMATRRVYHKQFLASGLPLNERTLGFLPAHAMLRISQDFPHWSQSGVRFNNVSDRPRNPANQADAPALAAMDWFRRHPRAPEYSAVIREADGRETLHYAAPVWTEAYCLSCHDSPEAAPPTIRERYSTGYGYRPGDLRGVMSIRIPMQQGQASALALWRQELLAQALGALAVLLILGLLLDRLVVRRLRAVADAARDMAAGDYATRLTPQSRDEIGDLAQGFNAMAAAVENRQAGLMASEEEYRILADYSQGWEYWLGPDGRYRYVSPACQAICGHPPEDFLADPALMERLLHPDDLAAWRRHLDDSPAADAGEGPPAPGHHQTLLLRIRARDGQERWIEHACAPIHDPRGRYLGRRGINRDVTERHLADVALRDSEAKLRGIYQAAPIGMGLVRNRVFLEVNDGFCALLGHDREELLGQSARMIYPSDAEYERVGEDKYRQIREHGLGRVETRLRRKNGDIVQVELSSVPLDARNPDLGVAFTALDITQRKRAEELERFSAFQAGIAEMSTSVLHNIGNAITAVSQDAGALDKATAELLRLAELLERDALGRASAGEASETRQRGIQLEAARALRHITEDDLVRRARRLGDSVRHIADIIRVQQSAAQPNGHRSSFGLHQAIQAALDMQGEGLAQRRIQVSVAVDPAVETVTLSHNRLLQTLINVVRNGIEAIDALQARSPDHHGRLDIQARATPGGSLRLTVRDNGIGFDPHLQPRMFSFGFSTNPRGTCFGPPSVAVFAQEAGGSVSLTSPGPGQGATLTLELPLPVGREGRS